MFCTFHCHAFFWLPATNDVEGTAGPISTALDVLEGHDVGLKIHPGKNKAFEKQVYSMSAPRHKILGYDGVLLVRHVARRVDGDGCGAGRGYLRWCAPLGPVAERVRLGSSGEGQCGGAWVCGGV